MTPLDNATPRTDRPVALNDDSASVETRLIPVIEEQLRVTTRTVETGRVTLTKTVHEAPETVTIPLQQEQYSIERMAINAYVDEMPTTRQEGDTTIYPVVKEVLVVQKRLMLIEEIRVTHQQTQTEETHTVPLRREEITIGRTPPHPERPV